VSGKIIR